LSRKLASSFDSFKFWFANLDLDMHIGQINSSFQQYPEHLIETRGSWLIVSTIVGHFCQDTIGKFHRSSTNYRLSRQ
jgi:hypothetical protein